MLREDAILKLAQLRAGLDAELFDELHARVLVGLQRIGLTAISVEGEHELSAESLAIGVLIDQRLKPPDDVGMVALGELRLDQQLERIDPQLGPPGDLSWAKGS